MEILFVRHGQTNLNNPRRMQGISNNPLNDIGIQQAKDVKEKLKNEKIDIIFCSPLIRAIETAEIINEERYIKCIIDKRICEMDFGDIEGSLVERNSYWNMSARDGFVNGETFNHFLGRVSNFIDELKVKHRDKRVLIVAHGGVARAFKCHFEGIPKDKDITNYGIENCAIAKFIVND